MKRAFNKYFIILVVGFVIWVAETAYFGFNKTPESGAEAFLDLVSAAMIIYGIIGDLTTNLRIHKHYHNISTTNVHTKKVEVTGDNQRIVYRQSFKVAPEAIKKPEKPVNSKVQG